MARKKIERILSRIFQLRSIVNINIIGRLRISNKILIASSKII